jgi:hypothetical protein
MVISLCLATYGLCGVRRSRAPYVIAANTFRNSNIKTVGINTLPVRLGAVADTSVAGLDWTEGEDLAAGRRVPGCECCDSDT